MAGFDKVSGKIIQDEVGVGLSIDCLRGGSRFVILTSSVDLRLSWPWCEWIEP